MNKIASEDSETNLLNGALSEDEYENISFLSKTEILYMRSFDLSYCFMLIFPGEFIENKSVLVTNLNLLRQFVKEAIALYH